MNTLARISRTALLPALLVALALPAAAQTVSAVRVAVVDPSTGQELAVVTPGSEISMAPGESVMLRLFQPQGERKRDRMPIPATFGFGPNATPLAITSTSPERGEVVVRLGDASPGQRLHIGWKLANRVKAYGIDDTGKVNVRVVAPRVAAGQEYYVPGYRSYGSQVDAVVDAYYRGILLREPDPSGSQGFRAAIARGDYDSVRQAAVDIARSEESYRISREGRASAEQRLTAIYQNLLGLSPEDVSWQQWSADLAAIQRGDIASVVQRIVDSRAFQYRFGFYYGR